jgi:hypothetical protein
LLDSLQPRQTLTTSRVPLAAAPPVKIWAEFLNRWLW